jgi:hypothetical protein
MRLDFYRHFLRIKIEGSKLTIYPIRLDRVPRRSGWRKASEAEIAQRQCKADRRPDRSRRQQRAIASPEPGGAA